MLDIADRGWPIGSSNPEIEPEAAHMVAHYLIGEMLRLSCPFDLRLFVNKALPDYQQWKDGEAESDWRDLITASIEEHLVAVRHSEEPPVSREARKRKSKRSSRRSCATMRPATSGSGPGSSEPANRSGRFTVAWPRFADRLSKRQNVKASNTDGLRARPAQRKERNMAAATYERWPVGKPVVKDNVRKRFSDESLRRHADSLKKDGQLRPLLVLRDGTLIAGERTLRAAKLAGLTHVEVKVLEGDLSPARDQEAPARRKPHAGGLKRRRDLSRVPGVDGAATRSG